MHFNNDIGANWTLKDVFAGLRLMHFLSRRTDEGTSFKKGSLDVHSSNYSISYDSSSIYFLLLNENIAQKTFTKSLRVWVL